MTNSVFFPESKNTSSTKKNLVFAWHLANGEGDTGHLIDAAGPVMFAHLKKQVDDQDKSLLSIGRMEADKFKPVYVVCVDDKETPERVIKMIHRLINHGITKQLEIFPKEFKSVNEFMEKNLVEYLIQFKKLNDNVHIIWNIPEYLNNFHISPKKSAGLTGDNVIKAYLEDSNGASGLKQQLENAAGLIYVSTFRSELLADALNSDAKKISLAEHCSPWGMPCADETISLGIGSVKNYDNRTFSYDGIFIPESLIGQADAKSSEDLLAVKSKLACQFHNKKFVQDLVADEKEPSPIAYLDFLKSNFFAPAYLHTKYGNALFIQSTAISELAKNKNCSFLIKEAAFDSRFLDKKLLIEHGFTVIEIVRHGEKQMIPLTETEKPGRKITLFSAASYNLDDHDFDLAFQIAPSLAGCAGDKTFEKIVAHALFMFFEQDHWKEGVSKGLKSLVEKYETSEKYKSEKLSLEHIAYYTAIGWILEETLGNSHDHERLKQYIDLFKLIGSKTTTTGSDDFKEEHVKEVSDHSKKIAAFLDPQMVIIWNNFNSLIKKRFNVLNKLTDVYLTYFAKQRPQRKNSVTTL